MLCDYELDAGGIFRTFPRRLDYGGVWVHMSKADITKYGFRAGGVHAMIHRLVQ